MLVPHNPKRRLKGAACSQTICTIGGKQGQLPSDFWYQTLPGDTRYLGRRDTSVEKGLLSFKVGAILPYCWYCSEYLGCYSEYSGESVRGRLVPVGQAPWEDTSNMLFCLRERKLCY
eukprot:1271741-Rhodomonas_salina.2